MKLASLQFALRETRAIFTSKRAWGGLGVASLILGISGPFQTFEIFSLGPRLIYWVVVTVLTFATGVFFGSLMSNLLEKQRWPFLPRLLFVGIAAGIPVAFVVWVINLATFGWKILGSIPMLSLAFYSIIIAMGIAVLFVLFDGKNNRPKSIERELSKPAILLRLPTHLRGKLLTLSVHDHYVEIITNKGKHLHLMRFGDAIKETQGINGIQIHRSHWVAMSEIKSVYKSNGKTIVQTHSGKELPVSRTYVSALKEAGLLV
ncbi:MAG: LytTR family transcriptional regulator [Devosiaceae bacterium]|nr:LytTR family transcriptional regulator [Devosiaceae bacterium]